MVRIYLAQNNGGDHVDIAKEQVEYMLETNADGLSTTATRNGIRIETDGKGEHTKKLPNDLHHYVHETDSARFTVNRDNT